MYRANENIRKYKVIKKVIIRFLSDLENSKISTKTHSL